MISSGLPSLKKALLIIFSILVSTILLLNYYLYIHHVKSDSLARQEIIKCHKTRHSMLTTSWWKDKCFFHNCFEINECHYSIPERIKVYIYPEYQYTVSNEVTQYSISNEYSEILNIIRQSVYYEPLPNKACIFIPSLDTLNERNLNSSVISELLLNLPR